MSVIPSAFCATNNPRNTSCPHVALAASFQAGITGHEEPEGKISHDHVRELNERREKVRAASWCMDVLGSVRERCTCTSPERLHTVLLLGDMEHGILLGVILCCLQELAEQAKKVESDSAARQMGFTDALAAKKKRDEEVSQEAAAGGQA